MAAPTAGPAAPAPGLLRFITCGSVDDGKSTLIGRLLHDCGALPDDPLAALVREARREGVPQTAPDLARLLDGLAAEREQGITIDVAYRHFGTARRRFIVADTPGHAQYTRNMVTGASTADAAVVLVDARKGLTRVGPVQGLRHAGAPAAAAGRGYFGASRIAPSSRMTSPLSMSFSTMCFTSLA